VRLCRDRPYFNSFAIVSTPARARGCYACTWFQGRMTGVYVVCEHRSAVQVIGTPALGCAYRRR
jgi:hypothetical protein